jgi:hypothetical protein
MLSSYYYFLASLPELSFGGEPPYSTADVLNYSKSWLPAADHAILCALAHDDTATARHTLAARVGYWETALRNALVSARAAHLGREAGPYLHGSAIADSHVRTVVQEAVRDNNPLEAERRLDALRWAFYDELGAGQIFSLARAAAYVLKTRILERWATLDETRGAEVLDAAIHEAAAEQEYEQ